MKRLIKALAEKGYKAEIESITLIFPDKNKFIGVKPGTTKQMTEEALRILARVEE